MQAAQLSFTQFNGLGARKSLSAPSMQPAAAVTRGELTIGGMRYPLPQPPGLTRGSGPGRAAGLRLLTVEARVMSRREATEKRHKRIRSKVSPAGAPAPAAATVCLLQHRQHDN